jgi:hypothetical protein
MTDEATLAQLNGEYVMPPDAGPAWREAAADGIDMSLIELCLEQSPAERLAAHQRALDFVLELQQARNRHATR